MPSDKPEKDGFLAAVEAKIAALKTLAESYRAAVALGALGQPGDLDVSPAPIRNGVGMPGRIDLPTGAFLGKSIPSAIKLYLSAARQKKTIREIAAALKDGGVESLAANFEGTVTSALNRLKANGDVLRFDEGWALAEFYPDNFRSRLAKDKSANPKKKPAKKLARAAKKPRQAETKKEPTDTLNARMMAFLRAHGDKTFTNAELATEFGVDVRGVAMMMGRMVSRGMASKHADGRVGVADGKSEVSKGH